LTSLKVDIASEESYTGQYPKKIMNA